MWSEFSVHRQVQSNGVLRAHDLDAMLLRHPNERAICIDHFAALVVEAGRYRVLSLANQPGSVSGDEQFLADRSGRPGVWVKEADSEVRRWLAPAEGALRDLVRMPVGDIVPDVRVAQVRQRNSAEF